MVHRTDSIGRFQHCASFDFFQISHLLFIKITSLDTCQKTVSKHAPQFRSNLFCSEINSNHACQCLNGSLSSKQTMHGIPILPLGKGYKYPRLLSRWHFYCSILCLLLCSRTHLLRRHHRSQNTLLGFKDSSPRTPPTAMASISEIPEVHFSFPTCTSAFYSPSDFFSCVSYLRPFSSRILGAI